MVDIEIIGLESEATKDGSDGIGLPIGQTNLLGGRHLAGDFHHIDQGAKAGFMGGGGGGVSLGLYVRE